MLKFVSKKEKMREFVLGKVNRKVGSCNLVKKHWRSNWKRDADLMDSLLLPKLSSWCSSGFQWLELPWCCSPVTSRQCTWCTLRTQAWWCPLMATWYVFDTVHRLHRVAATRPSKRSKCKRNYHGQVNEFYLLSSFNLRAERFKNANQINLNDVTCTVCLWDSHWVLITREPRCAPCLRTS